MRFTPAGSAPAAFADAPFLADPPIESSLAADLARVLPDSVREASERDRFRFRVADVDASCWPAIGWPVLPGRRM
jgi:hypothetical protein